MAINPRKIKKKVTPRPAKDLRSTDPKDLRNKALREANRAANENKPRPAKDIKASGQRAQFLKDVKAGTIKAKAPSVGARVGGVLRATGSRTFGAIGAIVDPTFMSGKGEGKLNNDPVTKYVERSSTMKGVEKKFKREIRQGTELAKTGVKVGSYKNYGEKIGPSQPKAKSSGFGPRISEGAKLERLRASRAALNKGKSSSTTNSSGNTSKVGGPGGARAYENVKDKKSSAASTAATSAATSSGRKRPSTRYQRNELAMEQRNRSSSGQRKSILSLFRKG